MKKHRPSKPNLGNQNACRKAGCSYLLSIDGKHPSGISQITARVEYADGERFPRVFKSSQAVKAFIRKAERLGNSFSQSSVSVLVLAS